ncbi:cell division protein ZipA [Aliikangiella coralliicola]|uniref:Cell division protein ZipA n=1 Tax=Aliikangiella coralliicola TaxID=2592383 RepID=A0A545U4R8_9GAMM|nr:cell division protein ZipA [Aliikangiella coralliicola]TQV84471.1 cell division protein ZipA [Aliikangiella coralliicola]
MDWQIRIALLIAGIGVIGYILYDYQRRKKAQTEKQRLIEQMRNAANQVDSQGFDFTGVGNVRKKDQSDSEQQEPTGEPEIDNRSTGAHTDSDVKMPKPSKPAKKQPTEQLALGDLADSQNQVDSKVAAEPDLVCSLILRAEEGKAFSGKDFMPILLSQGLRHGELGIFHRHTAGVSGKPGAVLYSVANAVNPGTFDLSNIEAFETPAFAFFMTLPGPKEPVNAYEGMVKTIRLIKQELGGQILDQSKSVYTEQTHQHQVELLRDYQTRHSLLKK